jgi:hypothetical protein
METNQTYSDTDLITPDPLAIMEKIAPWLFWLGYLVAAWYVLQAWDDLRSYEKDVGSFFGHLIIFGGLALIHTVSWCFGMIVVNQARDIKSLAVRTDNDD